MSTAVHRSSYWCFISYSHANNKEEGRKWATWLHQAIETYEVPKDFVGTTNARGDIIPPFIYPVFRDEDELAADADLAAPIYRALDDSKILIVLCSPLAAASTYVNDEIRYFKQIGRSERVLAAIIEGEPNASWDEANHTAGIRPEEECFPEALRHQVASDGTLLAERAEPLAADFRLGRAQGWVSPEAYRQALHREGINPANIDERVETYRRQSELMKLKVIAGVLGVPLGKLTQRDKAHQLAAAQKRARTLRRWLALVGLLALFAVAAGAAGWWYEHEATEQKKLAEKQTAIANQQTQRANEQTKKANEEKQQSDQNAAIALEKQKEADAQRQKTEHELSQSAFLQGIRLLQENHQKEALAYLAASLRAEPDNLPALERLYTLLVSQDSWPLPTILPVGQTGKILTATFSPDGTRILTVAADKNVNLVPDQMGYRPSEDAHAARLWDSTTGQPVGAAMQMDGSIRQACFSPDGSRILLSADKKIAQLWDGHAAEPVGPPLTNDYDLVTPAIFSPDGNVAVTVSGDGISGSARLWNARTGQALGAAMNQNTGIISVAFSPDSKWLATTSWNHTAQVWDAATGRPQGSPLVHPGAVYSAQFNPSSRLNSNLLVTASEPGGARFWNFLTGQTVGGYMPQSFMLSADFNPDGTCILTLAPKDSTALMWNVPNGTPLAALQHLGRINDFSFSPSPFLHSRLVTASSDGTARLWDGDYGKPIGEPMKCEGEVLSAQFSRDSRRILTVSTDGLARLWNGFDADQSSAPIHPASKVTMASFSPDGKLVLCASDDNSFTVWDVRKGDSTDEPLECCDDLEDVSHATFSNDGRRLITTTNISYRIWDVGTQLPTGDPVSLPPGSRLVSISPDGNSLLLTKNDLSAQVLDLATNQLVGAEMTPGGRIGSVLFSPDSTRVATVSLDKTARVWDARTGAPVSPSLSLDSFETKVWMNSGGTRLLAVTDEKTARLWDSASGQPLGLPITGDGISKAAISPDGTLVALVIGHRTAQLYNADTGQAIGAVLQHTRAINVLAFSPDNSRLLTASDDGTARLWDARTAQPLGLTMIHQGAVDTAIFSADGLKILTGAEDQMVRLWDANSGQPIGYPMFHGGSNPDDIVFHGIGIGFSPDGSRILTFKRNHAFIHDLLPPSHLGPPPWLPDLAEAVCGLALSKSGSLDPVATRKLFEIKKHLANATGDDFWTRTGRWFFADRETRTLSPQSTITFPDYKKAATPPRTAPVTLGPPPALPSADSLAPTPASLPSPAPVPPDSPTVATISLPSADNSAPPPVPSPAPIAPSPAPPSSVAQNAPPPNIPPSPAEDTLPPADHFDADLILNTCLVNGVLNKGRFESEFAGKVCEFVGTVVRLNSVEGLVIFHGGGVYPRNWDIQLNLLRSEFAVGRSYRVRFRLTQVKNVPFTGYSFRGDVLHRSIE